MGVIVVVAVLLMPRGIVGTLKERSRFKIVKWQNEQEKVINEGTRARES